MVLHSKSGSCGSQIVVAGESQLAAVAAASAAIYTAGETACATLFLKSRNRWMPLLAARGGRVECIMIGPEDHDLEFRSFDAGYVARLTEGDPETEAHFNTYFSQFLSLKLRSRHVSDETACDVRQETLYRVLKVLRKGDGVAHPERFGAFVNSVCTNVMREFARRASDTEDYPEEVRDHAIDLERSLITAERKRMVKAVLDELPAKDREILRMVFFEEADRDEICARLKIQPAYLRVLLHRAKARFQAASAGKGSVLTQMLLLLCNEIAARVTN